MTERTKYAHQDPNDDLHGMMNWIIDNPPNKWLEENGFAVPDQTLHPSQPTPTANPLPPLLSWDEMMQDLETNGLPPELIEGVLHKGCKGCISGSSKAGKTWTLVNLAVAAASGFQWLGLSTIRSKILYLDFELHRSFAQQRFKWVREKMNVDENLVRENLTYWNL